MRRFVERTYRTLAQRRLLLVLAFAVFAAVSAIWIGRSLKLEEDIAAMLPDDDSQLARDFELLRHAPFSRKILISLHAESAAAKEKLIPTVEALKAALPPNYFRNVVSGVDEARGPMLLSYMSGHPASLLTEGDLAAIEAELTPDGVKAQVTQNKRQLMSFDGFVTKQQILKDPLALRDLSLAKMRFVNLVPNVRLERGHFVSEDGMNALIIAETDVAMTDSSGGRALLDAFEAVADKQLPDGISATLLSSHRYTVANSTSIQRDLRWILGVSLAALLLIFGIFLRNWRAIFVFLVPVFVLIFALIPVILAFHEVSAITIGFGAVLLGISVDFALHVYFAMRLNDGAPGEVLGAICRPMTFCALTTIGAFAVMLLSALPGQRQLAVFSASGIACGLLLSLFLLPQALAGIDKQRVLRPAQASGKGRMLLIPWLVFLWICGLFASGLEFDGSLRNLSLVPKALRQDEQALMKTWGNFRGKAMVFAEGETLQQALERNDALFSYLQGKVKDEQLVSISPVLPSLATQQARHQRWSRFWTEHRDRAVQLLTEAGWPPKASAAFGATVDDPAKPVTPEQLREAGPGELLDSLVVELPNRTLVMTLVPDTAALAASFHDDGPVGCNFVSQSQTGRAIGEAISRDFKRFVSFSLLAIVLLVSVLFRDWKRILASLIPVVTGLLAMFGLMAMLGMSLNLFNVVAAILIIGLGVDYGIFMVHRMAAGADHATVLAVMVSGLTTLAGFGALLLGRHPSLRSIGTSVSIGIGFAMVAALWIVPAACKALGIAREH